MLRISHPPPLHGSCDQRRSLYRLVEEMFDDSSVSDSSTTLNRWEPARGKGNLWGVQKGLGYICWDFVYVGLVEDASKQTRYQCPCTVSTRGFLLSETTMSVQSSPHQSKDLRLTLNVSSVEYDDTAVHLNEMLLISFNYSALSFSSLTTVLSRSQTRGKKGVTLSCYEAETKIDRNAFCSPVLPTFFRYV